MHHYSDDKEHLLSSPQRTSEDSLDKLQSEQSSRPHRPSQWKLPLLLTILLLTLLVSLTVQITFEHTLQHPFSVPTLPVQDPCEHATARPSWHELPLHRRHAFVKAVQRLSTLPSQLGLNTSLYDDFTYVHIQLVWQMHHVAMSLPFHRYFLAVFERVVQERGGYDGKMPFWDWTRDAGDPHGSVVWDDWAGFGGNGTGNDRCVEDGVFGRMGKTANYSESGYEPHCVRRVFENSDQDGVMHSREWSAEVVKDIVEESTSYAEFRERLENGPHRHLHLGIGGEMPTASSTNDPIFFLHHSQVDRLWWLWQQRDPERLNIDFFGPADAGDEGLIGLHDNIKMLGLAEDVTVKDVMATDTELLCYKYKMEL